MAMTRREYLKQVAGVTAAVALPELLVGRNAALRGGGAEDIAGKGSLKARAAARGMLAGCAVNAELFRRDPDFRNLLVEQYSILVPENCLKWNILRPTPDTYSFTDSDSLVAFAEAHGMKVRGHNFVWHEALPKWFASTVTKENARKLLIDHITTVGGRYKGRIHSWDVVNEAIQVSDGLPGGFRNSSWQKMLGGSGAVPEYIEVAYRTARRVDPKALLVYNDYGIEGEDEGSAKKREAVMGLLREMQRRNVPVDALGVQSHITAVNKDGSVPVYGDGLMKMIAEARMMGLKVLVTEMDVNDRYLAAPIGARDAAVAKMYGSYLRTVLKDSAVIAVLTWGITDKYTWLNHEDARTDGLPERPLSFDAEMQPTAAFAAEVKALQEAPLRG